MFLNMLKFLNMLADLLCTMMMMRNKSRNPAVTAVVTQTAIVYKIFQSPERKGNDEIFIKAFKHRVNIAIVREWTDLSTRRAQECLFIVNTFNRDRDRRWSLRSILILSLTIVASTVTGVKAGDDETLSRSNSWALILFKPAEVQSRRIWVTVTVQSHWISLLYFSRRTDGHRGILRGI